MTGCEDGRLYIYDLMKKNPIKSIQAHKKVLSALDLHESGGLVSGGHDGTVCFWKIWNIYYINWFNQYFED